VVEKVQIGHAGMAADDRMVELDRELDLETVVGLEARPLVAILHLDSLEHANEALGRILLGDPGRLDQECKRAGAAVHDRHFRGTQINVEIIDAQTGQGRHQVLDGGDPDAILDHGGRQRGITDLVRIGLDFDDGSRSTRRKDDAGAGRCRSQRHQDLFPCMHAHAGGTNDVLESSLLDQEWSQIAGKCAGED
jgi:hypothetical protein